jgi:hypothetical protein
MAGSLTKPPEGVELNALSTRVFAILSKYTAFPWPILMTQAKRCGVDAARLTHADLHELVPHLAAGVERYTSPEKGAATRAELTLMAARLLRDA